MADINEVPKSFNKALLEVAFRKYTDDPNLELLHFETKDIGGDISDHYSSIMFKVNVDYKRSVDQVVQHVDAIVKSLPDDTDKSHNEYLEDVKDSLQFDTELAVYDRILPKLERMLCAKRSIRLAPGLIFQTNHPVPILIMENMITLGYTTIKDRSQISFESATMLIEKLAQFHATSFMLNWQKDESVAQLDEVYFDYHMDESCIDEFDQRIGMMTEMNGFENVVAKLEGSTTEMFRHVRKLYNNADDAACKVLCHGDMKFENTMVKMNENGVENAIFVDFAYANHHTPAIDLYEFLYKVPALDVIMQKEQRQELIDCYMTAFRSTLAAMGFEEVDETIQKIKSEMRRCNVLQVWFVLFLVVNKLERFEEDSEVDTEVFDFEEKWLKTVLNELLTGNDEWLTENDEWLTENDDLPTEDD